MVRSGAIRQDYLLPAGNLFIQNFECVGRPWLFIIQNGPPNLIFRTCAIGYEELLQSHPDSSPGVQSQILHPEV
jgi:hypothetical protein